VRTFIIGPSSVAKVGIAGAEVITSPARGGGDHFDLSPMVMSLLDPGVGTD